MGATPIHFWRSESTLASPESRLPSRRAGVATHLGPLGRGYLANSCCSRRSPASMAQRRIYRAGNDGNDGMVAACPANAASHVPVWALTISSL